MIAKKAPEVYRRACFAQPPAAQDPLESFFSEIDFVDLAGRPGGPGNTRKKGSVWQPQNRKAEAEEEVRGIARQGDGTFARGGKKSVWKFLQRSARPSWRARAAQADFFLLRGGASLNKTHASSSQLFLPYGGRQRPRCAQAMPSWKIRTSRQNEK